MRDVLAALACLMVLVRPSAAMEGPRHQVALHPVSAWTKVCARRAATCYTSRRFGRDPRKPPILELSVRTVEGDATRVARFLMPVGLRTDLGLSFSVDGGARQWGVFKACTAAGCLAKVAVPEPVLTSMKRGGTMQIVTTNGDASRLDFYLSLDGFASAYAGPGREEPSGAPPARKELPHGRAGGATGI